MFEKQTLKRVQRKKTMGRDLAARAAELMREESLPTRKGKRGRAAKAVAVAMGLAKAATRRAGAGLSSPARGRAAGKKVVGRGRVTMRRDGEGSTTMASISRQTQGVAARRGSARRGARGATVKATMKKASTTKGPARRKGPARKMGRARSARMS
jgi:hypothetical protein